MAKFEKGDRFKVVSVQKYDIEAGIHVGDTGTILDDHTFPRVRMDKYNHKLGSAWISHEEGRGWCFKEDQLELIQEEEPATQRLKNLYNKREMKQKTPMQEFIKVLKTYRDTSVDQEKQYKDYVLSTYYNAKAKAFEDAINLVESMLGKEKEMMCQFAFDYNDEFYNNGKVISIQDYYKETFKTKER